MPPEALLAVLHDVAAPWRDELVRRSLVEMTLLGIPAGVLGCWIVLYGMSYGAESLAHGMFPGLGVARLAGIPLILGGAVGVLVAAVGIWLAGRIPSIERDSAIAVSVSALCVLGVLLALSPQPPPGIASLLFGDVLGVTEGDLLLSAGFGLLVGSFGWLLHARLLAAGFDGAGAASLGVSTAAMEAVL